MSRTKSKFRCEQCRMRVPLCLCDRIPRLEIATRLVVIMHWREVKTTTNTARLGCLALPNSELAIRGLREESLAGMKWSSPDSDSLVLYPTEDAEVLTPDLIQSLRRPLTLIVPDGSWRQAARVPYREPALQGLRRVKLAPGAPSNYRLRRESHPHALSTLEAIARALGVIEGPETQFALENLLDLMVTRTLWSKGKLTTEECGERIPRAALESRMARG